jgi:hypothetical protein
MRIDRTTLAALFALVLPAAGLAPATAAAETIGGNPGPQYNYVCPHADNAGPLDCYFDAVQHLYTMCRNVKSIEIIEFGYEDSQEGINAAKFESCVDKQKLNMARPYQAALKEARISKQAAEGVQSLQEYWLEAMQHIRWNHGETDEQYKDRVNVRAYQDFKDKIAGIQTILTVVKERTAPPKAARAKGNAPAAAEAPKATAKSAAKPSKMKPDAPAGSSTTSAKAPQS